MSIKNVEAILAIDLNNGLAKENTIPWKNKKDLQFFKDKTINNVVIMGSKTLFSLPNSYPLKNRINIVVTNNKNKYSNLYQSCDNILFVTLKEVIHILHNEYKDKTIFIIGGNQIYNSLLSYCSKIWLSRIKINYDCDLFFSYDISTFFTEEVYEDEILKIICLS